MHKIQAMAKNVGAKSKALSKKVVSVGSDYIANRVMLKPSLDRWAGERADKTRTQVIRRRESRANDKAMGY